MECRKVLWGYVIRGFYAFPSLTLRVKIALIYVTCSQGPPWEHQGLKLLLQVIGGTNVDEPEAELQEIPFPGRTLGTSEHSRLRVVLVYRGISDCQKSP